MGEKKNLGRFTLQFNLEDPQQQTVSELLDQQGRHKTQFLTNAVLYYIQRSGLEGNDHAALEADEARLERMLLSIIKKHPQLLAVPADEGSTQKGTPARISPPAPRLGNAVEGDALAAISETLAAFQQE